jgi:hypothetical protein
MTSTNFVSPWKDTAIATANQARSKRRNINGDERMARCQIAIFWLRLDPFEKKRGENRKKKGNLEGIALCRHARARRPAGVRSFPPNLLPTKLANKSLSELGTDKRDMERKRLVLQIGPPMSFFSQTWIKTAASRFDTPNESSWSKLVLITYYSSYCCIVRNTITQEYHHATTPYKNGTAAR